MSQTLNEQTYETLLASGKKLRLRDPAYLQRCVSTQIQPILFMANQLSSLHGSIPVRALYQPDNATAPTMMVEGYPKLILTHFSHKIRQAFFERKNYEDRTILFVDDSTICVVGGDQGSLMICLQWMLNSCGEKHVEWEKYKFQDKPFYRYYHFRASAQILGCVYLENLFQHRMQQLADRRIHSDDVAALYNEVPRHSEMANMLVNHVASFFLERGPDKKTGPYMELRLSIPAFDEDCLAVMMPVFAQRDHEVAAETQLEDIVASHNERVKNWQRTAATAREFVRNPERNTYAEVRRGGFRGRTSYRGGRGGSMVRANREQVNNEAAVAKEVKSPEVDLEVEATAKKSEEEEKGKKEVKKVAVGVDSLEQARKQASHIQNKAARRREKKRLAKVAAEEA
jgi:hypothetical protein